MIDRLLIFGDSITWGADDQEGLGWANRLRMYIQTASHEIAVYNCGIRGDTTSDLLKRFEIEATARKSRNNEELVLFAIGINDSRTVDGKPQTELLEFAANLKKLIDKARAVTDKIIFIGLTRVVDSKANWSDHRGKLEYMSARVKDFDNTIRSIAENNELPYLEMQNILEDSDLPEDGLHPDAGGHEKMFNRIKSELIQYLDLK